MTNTPVTADVPMTDEPEPTAAEIEAFQRDLVFAAPDRTTPELYPRMRNISAGHLYRVIIRAEAPQPAEYVTVPMSSRLADAKTVVAVAEWNMLWEAAQFRRRVFGEDDLPPELWQVAARGDVNVIFIPRSAERYHEYAPLFHLLSRPTLERFGLPALNPGVWPFLAQFDHLSRYLPVDFEQRLGRAWASTVWRHLMPASPVSAFSRTDPIRLLAHNLDFWVPPVTEVMQEVLRSFPTAGHGIPEGPVTLEDGSQLEGAVVANPRVGSDLWCGEAEAAEVVRWTVAGADASGNLRGILDAVRSNRVEDDFSARWSYAREDFERKLHRKRSKVKVRFVELTDTIPVQGPDTEVEGRMVTADFLALLDTRDRQIVVVLNSGTTKLTDVAKTLGYSNHSGVSKRLKRIREQASDFFDGL